MGNKAPIAGILSIVSGVFGVLFGGLMIGGVFAFRSAFGFMGGMDPFPAEMLTAMSALYIVLGVFFALLGVVGIVGGVYAIKRKYWWLAMVGAAAGVMTFFLTGAVAVVLAGMAQKEFEVGAPYRCGEASYLR